MTFRPRRSRRTIALQLGLAVVLVGGALATGAVVTNAFGAGDRFGGLAQRVDRFFNPVPERTIPPIVRVTPAPVAAASPSPSAAATSAPGSSSPGPSATPTSPSPAPVREPVDVDILAEAGVDPAVMFSSQVTKDWCAPAGTQMVLAIHGAADTSDAFQRELDGRVREWESFADSHNGGWGPDSMRQALEAYGVPGYEVRAYDSRQDALRDAARAIEATRAPVILLAWRGAHTWVITGYRADGDPTAFSDVHVEGAYVLDPWFPRVSSIWGESDPAGTFQDEDEMVRNFLRWQRPEGDYPDRDGLFIAVVPTQPLARPGG